MPCCHRKLSNLALEYCGIKARTTYIEQFIVKKILKQKVLNKFSKLPTFDKTVL